MRIVEELPPTPRSTWRLAWLREAGAPVRFGTGSDLFKSTRESRSRRICLGVRGVEIVPGPNVVAEALLDHRGGRFADVEDAGFEYWSHPEDALGILDAALRGRLRVEAGLIRGRFTFRVVGGHLVSLVLHRGAVPIQGACGAVNVDDLVAAMPGR